MSKKLLSMLLCVLMVISSVSCLFTMIVSAAVGILYEELLTDGEIVTSGGNDLPVKVNSIQSAQLADVNSKHLGKWLRASGGVSLDTDLDSTGAVWTSDSTETFPTTFGANAQVVTDPTNADNKAIRTVQSLQQYVDSSKIVSGKTYTVKFDYINRGPEELDDKENRVDFTLSTPVGSEQTTKVTDEETGEETTVGTGVYLVGTTFKSPFAFEGVKVINKTDANLTVGSYGTGIRFNFGSTSTDTWQSVTVQFTLGEEDSTLYNQYVDEKVILSIFTQNVSLTSGADDHAIYYDNLSLTLHNKGITGEPEFYSADGTKVESNDYAGATIVKNTDGTLTATVDYNKNDTTLNFIGWYNGDEAIAYTESVTFVADGSVVPVPRFLTYNRLSELGSFEYETTGEHLHYVEAMPESGKAPNYPVEGTWGIASNNGYVTYTDVTNSKSKVANTYTETIYETDGTSVSQTEHQGRKVSSWAQENNLTVVDTVAHSGNKSFEIKSADMAYVSGITTEKAGTYTLSYYVNDISAIKAASGAFSSAILSTPNIGVNRTGSDVYYDDATKTSSVSSQIPNHMSAGVTACNPYTFAVFRSTKNLTDVSITEGQTWYKVTHNFTTTENHQKVYFAIYNKTGANVYIDDVVCYNETDIVSYFGAPKAFKDDFVTEYEVSNLPATVSISGAQVVGAEVTATVDYDVNDTSMKFIGWYNGDELVSDSATTTVTIKESDYYYPKFVTTNIMVSAGSYENFYDGQDVGYLPATPTETDESGNLVAPDFGNDFGWSYHFNGGFVTNSGTTTHAQNVYAGDIYLADGTTEAIAQLKGTRAASALANYPSYITTAKAHTGNKSLAMAATIGRAISIPVKAGSTYNLSFWSYLADSNSLSFAVATTVNIGNYGGGLGVAHIAQGNANLEKFRLAFGNTKIFGTWNKNEVTFTVPKGGIDTVYLALNNTKSDIMYLDDFVCTEVVDSSVEDIEIKDVDGNVVSADENFAVNAEIVNNLDGTSTATIKFVNNGAYIFDGWYNVNGELVSAEANFTFATGTYTADDLKASIIDRNILTDASGFETYTANEELRTSKQTDLDSNAPTTKYWGVSYAGGYYKDDYFAISVKGTLEWAPTVANVTAYYEKIGADKFVEKFGADTTVEELAESLVDKIVPHSGDKMIALYTKYRSAIRKIEGLKANTDYVLSFYTYMNSASDRITSAIVSNVYDGIYASNLESIPEGAEILGTTFVGYTDSEYRTWQKVTVSFNSGNNTEAYIHLQVNAIDNNTIFAPVVIDDMVVSKPITTYNGTAIRASSATKPQALRYKFKISNDLIADAYADWEVEEYGSIALRTYYLNGQELTLDGKYYGDGKERNVVKGVAYNKTEGKDIVFARDAVNTEFTAALTGIGRNSNGITNYLAWGDKYSVRNYIILKKGEKTITLYGEVTAVASVFDVMEAILEGSNADDIATVNSILYNETNGAAIREAFATRKGYSLPETLE